MSSSDKAGRIPPSPPTGKAGKTSARIVSAIKRPKEENKDVEDPEVATSTPDTPADPDASKGPSPPDNVRKRHPLGVRRLDDLLLGGLKQGSFTLLYGPSYLGKEHLARRCAVQALKAGIPAIMIHTDATVNEVHDKMAAIDPVVDDAAKDGLLRHVDCYSRSIEADEGEASHIEYVDGAMDLNGISLALNHAQKKLLGGHDQHLVILDSLSTITAYSNAQTAFRFLQVMLGKSRLVGATCIVLLDEGMHTEAEVQMFRHLMTGSLDVRDHNGKYQLRALGLSDQEGLGWIDYRFNQDSFEVTGSFAPGRIR